MSRELAEVQLYQQYQLLAGGGKGIRTAVTEGHRALDDDVASGHAERYTSSFMAERDAINRP
jgi:hypothetical protein